MEIHVTNRSWENVQGVEQNHMGVWLYNKIPEIILLCEASTDSFFFLFIISEVLFKSILSLYFGVLMCFW